jgi:hypothetical protein
MISYITAGTGGSPEQVFGDGVDSRAARLKQSNNSMTSKVSPAGRRDQCILKALTLFHINQRYYPFWSVVSADAATRTWWRYPVRMGCTGWS